MASAEDRPGVVFDHRLIRGKADFYKIGPQLLIRHTLQRKIFSGVEAPDRLALYRDELAAVGLEELREMCLVVLEFFDQHLCYPMSIVSGFPSIRQGAPKDCLLILTRSTIPGELHRHSIEGMRQKRESVTSDAVDKYLFSERLRGINSMRQHNQRLSDYPKTPGQQLLIAEIDELSNALEHFCRIRGSDRISYMPH